MVVVGAAMKKGMPKWPHAMASALVPILLAVSPLATTLRGQAGAEGGSERGCGRGGDKKVLVSCRGVQLQRPRPHDP
mgnify:CR=1 FL=1